MLILMLLRVENWIWDVIVVMGVVTKDWKHCEMTDKKFRKKQDFQRNQMNIRTSTKNAKKWKI